MKNAGDTLVSTRTRMSVIFFQAVTPFSMGSQAASAAIAAVSVFSNNAAAGDKAGQGLRSTFNRSGVQRSERHRCLDS